MVNEILVKKKGIVKMAYLRERQEHTSYVRISKPPSFLTDSCQLRRVLHKETNLSELGKRFIHWLQFLRPVFWVRGGGGGGGYFSIRYVIFTIHFFFFSFREVSHLSGSTIVHMQMCREFQAYRVSYLYQHCTIILGLLCNFSDN